MSTLTVEETTLFECLLEGEAGIANYGERTLKNKVHFWQDSGYMWCQQTKLWKAANSAVLRQSFFNELRQKIDNLADKIATSTLPDKKECLAVISGTKKATRTINTMGGIWREIEGYLSHSQASLNDYNDVLPLKGGKKINLRTSEVSDRTPADLWTYEIAATGVECSESAKADNLRYYTNYCRQPDGTINDKLLNYLQQLHGYWMTYETGDKAFYVILGVGGCGKSQLISRLQRIVTTNRVNACSRDVFVKPASEGNHATYYKCLEGLSLAYVSELEDGKSLNAAVIKGLTGGDIIRFREAYAKNEKYIKFRCKYVVITNDMFKMNGGDSGLVSRLRKILFTNDLEHIPVAERQANEQMLLRLNTQDGINATFAWWAEGAKTVFDNLANNISAITPPECVMDESAAFAEDNDSFKHFIADRCEVSPSPGQNSGYTYPRDDFHRNYVEFCRDFSYTGNQQLGKSQRVDRVRSHFPGQKTRGEFIGFRPKLNLRVNGQ